MKRGSLTSNKKYFICLTSRGFLRGLGVAYSFVVSQKRHRNVMYQPPKKRKRKIPDQNQVKHKKNQLCFLKCLKVHVIKQKRLVLKGENIQKKIFLTDQSLYVLFHQITFNFFTLYVLSSKNINITVIFDEKASPHSLTKSYIEYRKYSLYILYMYL